MHAKQERFDSLNYCDDMVFLTLVYLPFCNQISFIYRSGACFDVMLFTISTSCSESNESIVEAHHRSRLFRRKIRVYGQSTRQDHPLGNTDNLAVLLTILILVCYL